MALQRIGGTRSSRLEGSGAATEPAGQVVRVGLAGMESTDYFKLVPTEVALRRPPQQVACAFSPQDDRERPEILSEFEFFRVGSNKK